MGVASVALVYDLVRRRFGRAGGFVAGLVLALTPIAVAISRHNNPDALLVLCSVAALWCVVRALEDGRTRWLVLAGVAVGLGLRGEDGRGAAWSSRASRRRTCGSRRAGAWTAVRQLLAGGAALAVVGGAWPVLVALTPAASRPWVSGTSDNSIWSLIFGYNGLGRLGGQAGGPAGGGGPGGGGGRRVRRRRRRAAACSTRASAARPAGCSASRSSAGSRCSSRAGCAATDARTGWLIADRRRVRVDRGRLQLRAGDLPPVLRLAARPVHGRAGRRGRRAARRRRRGAARVLAPAAVVAGLVTELAVLDELPGQLEHVAPIMAGVAVLARGRARGRRRRRACARRCSASRSPRCCVAPATWSVQTLGHATSGTFPAGGPETRHDGGGGGGGGFGGGARGGGRRLRWRRHVRRQRVAHRRRSPTSQANGGGTIASRASRARRAPRCSAASTSPRSAASPAARARSASTGSPTASPTARSAGCSPTARAAACRTTAAPAASAVMAAVAADVHAGRRRRRAVRLRGRGGRAARRRGVAVRLAPASAWAPARHGGIAAGAFRGVMRSHRPARPLGRLRASRRFDGDVAPVTSHVVAAATRRSRAGRSQPSTFAPCAPRSSRSPSSRPRRRRGPRRRPGSASRAPRTTLRDPLDTARYSPDGAAARRRRRRARQAAGSTASTSTRPSAASRRRTRPARIDPELRSIARWQAARYAGRAASSRRSTAR